MHFMEAEIRAREFHAVARLRVAVYLVAAAVMPGVGHAAVVEVILRTVFDYGPVTAEASFPRPVQQERRVIGVYPL
jgi:hypothetical protein